MDMLEFMEEMICWCVMKVCGMLMIFYGDVMIDLS